jgi:hypothetical protein
MQSWHKSSSSQNAKDHGNQKKNVVHSHASKVANGPSIRIASRVALSPGARTPSYVNLFYQETEPF